MRKAFHGYILIAPVMIGCLVFTLIPFGIVLRYSLGSLCRCRPWDAVFCIW